MTEVRIATIIGSLLSVVCATWLATMLYAHLIAFGPHAFAADAGIWWVIGVPLALSSGVAAFIVTRRDTWLPALWSLGSLASFALRITVVAVLICGVLMIWLGFIVALALSGVPLHGSGGGVRTDIGSVVLGFQLVVFIIGEMLVLLLARWIATQIERDVRRIEEWKRPH